MSPRSYSVQMFTPRSRVGVDAMTKSQSAKDSIRAPTSWRGGASLSPQSGNLSISSAKTRPADRLERFASDPAPTHQTVASLNLCSSNFIRSRSAGIFSVKHGLHLTSSNHFSWLMLRANFKEGRTIIDAVGRAATRCASITWRAVDLPDCTAKHKTNSCTRGSVDASITSRKYGMRSKLNLPG